ncbi:MAG: CDP-6-deoxy-delta-3,4-glucoseen reductase [Gammaproteobacteria bacterium]|nr:CDP-6-deoxy-delta-3,4-glucoseen reductase [Gammaproteobacteria bacterium]
MSFTITLQSKNEIFTAREDETILAAALRSSHSFPYGCRNGACGSCKGKIISGNIQYGEIPLTGITEEEHETGFALFCQARPISDLIIEAREVAGVGDLAIRKLPSRVAKIEKLSHDVLRLFLKLPATERLQFLAGQYIDILLQNGKRRSFSLANAPYDDEFLELHIRHYDGGLFSEYAFHKMHEKSLLRIEGPLGTFFLREESDNPIIMVAGGTGFAPIKSIVEHLLGNSLKRIIYLYWGARGRQDLYLHELAKSWADQNKYIHYIPVLSEPGKDDQWQGRTGFVHNAVLSDFADLSGYEVYTCGPPPMVKAIQKTFVERGLAEDYIYSDSFEFAPHG